jgi:DNA-binding MarR family transcriptional regulator
LENDKIQLWIKAQRYSLTVSTFIFKIKVGPIPCKNVDILREIFGCIYNYRKILAHTTMFSNIWNVSEMEEYNLFNKTDFRVCLAGKMRMMSRVVTGIYSRHLKPFEITPSQLNILVVVGKMIAPKQTAVAEWLCMDKSTMSRELERLVDKGFLETVKGNDGRATHLKMTTEGRDFIEGVIPAWKQAQREVEEIIGSDKMPVVMDVAASLKTHFNSSE